MKTRLSLFVFVFLFQSLSAQWFQQTSGVTTDLNDVYFVNAQIGWAVGSSGVILKTTNGGTNWVKQTSGTSNSLKGVSFINENEGFAVGYYGTVLYTTNGGTNWTKQTTLYSSFDFSSVHMVNDSVAFISCGDIYGDGKVLRTTDKGANWTSRLSTIYLRGIFAHSESNIFAVGGGSTSNKIGYYKRSTNGGSNWTTPVTATIDRPTCVLFTSASVGYVAGFSGTINKTVDSGSTWASLTTGSTIAPFSDLWFSSSTTGYASCGNFLYTEKGLYKTTDSGDSWVKDSLPVAKKMYAIHGIDDNTIYLVGETGTILKSGTNTSVQDLTTSPAVFQLHQNYPNPFNPSTTISFSIPERSTITITVYNSLGEVVEKIFDGEMNAGKHNVHWNARFASGIYFYQMKAIGENKVFSSTKQMVLIK